MRSSILVLSSRVVYCSVCCLDQRPAIHLSSRLLFVVPCADALCCLLIFLYMTSRFVCFFFFFSSRRRHTRLVSDWSSDVCSSDLTRYGRAATCIRTRSPASPH